MRAYCSVYHTRMLKLQDGAGTPTGLFYCRKHRGIHRPVFGVTKKL